MNAILSFRTPGMLEKVLSGFGYISIRKKKFQEVPDVLHIFLPKNSLKKQKVAKKLRKMVGKYGIHQLLPEWDVKEQYGDLLKENYSIIDGRKVMYSCLQENMSTVLKRYGFHIGKVRLLIRCEDILTDMTRMLKAHHRYLRFMVFQGQPTPRKEQMAEQFYQEFGINTVFTQQPEQMDCNLLLVGDDVDLAPVPGIKLIIHVGGTTFRTNTPEIRDWNLPIPEELTGLACRQVELFELMGQRFPLPDEKIEKPEEIQKNT